MFDPLVTEYMLRKYNLAFISKPSNMEIPVISNLAWGAGFLPIDRENDREALKSILQAADYLKRDICSMAVYPEGTRSKTGELGPFHAGSFKIAQRAKAPVVIASIQGTEKVSKNIPFRPTHVKLDILEVIPDEEVKAMNTQELAARSRGRIEQNLQSTEGGK
jgi:1-acyl-sn-glycerol-3-phosphate acyltransferase